MGRREELAAARQCALAAAAGEGSVVLVTGPAGIGKTRLVEQILQPGSRGGQGPPVGRGYAVDRAAPALWPWQQALRALARRGEPDGTAALALWALQRMVERKGPIDAGAVAVVRRQALADIAEGLLTAASDAPLVVVLEDLQWADANSLELLRFVAGGIANSCLLVLGTMRDAAGDHLDGAGPSRLPHTVVLRLPPLTGPEVADYLVRLQGADASAAQADRVLRRSGGLPLLLDAAAADHIPAGEPLLAEIAATLLEQLSAEGREVVRAAALLGQPAVLDLLVSVTGRSGAAVLAALDEACRSGLLVRAAGWDGLEEPAFAVAHALLAEGLLSDVDVDVARQVHRRAALQLQSRAPGTLGYDAARIAAHWERAGPHVAAQRSAARWAERAAQDAQRALSFDQEALHRRAVVAALRAAHADNAELAAAVLEQARARYLSGSVADAFELCRDASALAAAAGRPDLLAGAALLVRWVTFPRAGQLVARLCRAALAFDQPAAITARLRSQLAVALTASGALHQARRHASQGWDLALHSGDPQAVLDAARAKELCLVGPDDVSERLQLADLAIDQADRLGQRLSAVIAQGWRLRGGYQLARLDLVEEALHAIVEQAAGSGLPLAHWHVQRCLAAKAALEGRFDDAREHNAQASELVRDAGDPDAAALSDVFGCHLALLRQDPREIPDAFWAAAATVEHYPLVLAVRARAQLLLGCHEEAAADYRRLRLALVEPVVDLRFAALLVHLADLARTFSNPGHAQLLASHLRPYAAYPGALSLPNVLFTGCPQRSYGQALHQAGALPEAEIALRAAVDHDTALDAAPYVALDQLALAEVLTDRGDPTAALPLIAAGAARARRLDLPGVLARADRLLSTTSAKARTHDPLTPREREVALLLLDALPNRRIAQLFVLSERTVESHVRSILAKLGFTNRTELVARWRP